MKTDKWIDEIFRSRLSEVDLPTPPAQDWAAMARAAKRGAVLAGKGGSSAMHVRWMRILGGTVAVATACYLAFGPRQAGPQPGSTLATAVPAALLPGTLSSDDQADQVAFTAEPESKSKGGTLADPAVPAASASASSPVAGLETMQTSAHQRSSDKVAEPRMHSTTTKSSTQTQGETRTVHTGDVNTRRTTQQGSPTGSASNAKSDGLSDAAMAQLAEPTSTYDVHAADQGSGGVTNEVGRSEVATMALLAPIPSALPYLPNPALQIDADEYFFFARWSFAPWLALGHSVYSDPEHAGTPEGLNAKTDLPVSYGLRVQYAVDRRLAFFTGISVAQKGGLSGTVVSSPSVSTDYQLSGSYLEVPLAFKFIVPLDKTDVYARAGLSLQFNMPNGTSKVTVHDDGLKEMSTLVLAGGSMGTAVDLGIGAQFRLCPRAGLFIEPSYQFGLSPVVKHPTFDDLPFNPRIHTFSLAAGLSLQLP